MKVFRVSLAEIDLTVRRKPVLQRFSIDINADNVFVAETKIGLYRPSNVIVEGIEEVRAFAWGGESTYLKVTKMINAFIKSPEEAEKHENIITSIRRR